MRDDLTDIWAKTTSPTCRRTSATSTSSSTFARLSPPRPATFQQSYAHSAEMVTTNKAATETYCKPLNYGMPFHQRCGRITSYSRGYVTRGYVWRARTSSCVQRFFVSNIHSIHCPATVAACRLLSLPWTHTSWNLGVPRTRAVLGITWVHRLGGIRITSLGI